MNNSYKIRIIPLFVFICFFYIVIIFNLYMIQIVHGSYYSSLGKKQYYVTQTMLPARAFIVDRHNKPLALNKESFSAFILPAHVEYEAQLKQFLRTHFPESLPRWQKHADAQFLFIKRRLSPDQIKLIEQSGMTDIKLLAEPSRFYPLSAAASVIGITDIDNQGLMGIELQCNNQLAGQATTCNLEREARSGHFHFSKKVQVQGKSSEPIKLTLDTDLQFLVNEEVANTVLQYNAQEGAAIIMDPVTGQIQAMVQVPSFDPNNTHELDMQQAKNKVTGDAYELGSVMKVFVALAALQEKVVTFDELIDCKNVPTAFIDGRKINTVESSVRGIIPFCDVIAFSNNIGIALVAKRLGQKLYDHYMRLGFGQKTGIELPGEHKGFVNPPNQWSKQSIISLSYGYEISATLLQLARAFALIANGGYLITSHLIDTAVSDKGKSLYSSDSLEVIKNILERTTLEGTTRKAAIKGYRVMSKTGTANMLVNGEYDTTQNLFTCAGIIQKDDYSRVIVVFIKNAQGKKLYASTVAAPLFERVAEQLLIHDKII
jgi:cell division protein FtsI (penicillin-binding protein 3)